MRSVPVLAGAMAERFSAWWTEVGMSIEWQLSVFDDLAVAYGVLATVALVSAAIIRILPLSFPSRTLMLTCIITIVFTGPNYSNPATRTRIWLDYSESIPFIKFPSIWSSCFGVCIP